MRVHIVVPYQSEAMRQLFAPFLTKDPPWLHISSSNKPNWDADLNYFLPWLGMLDHEIKGPSVMYYTHTNRGHERAVQWAAAQCRHVICMSETGREELKRLGVTTPITTIHPGVTGFAPRKRNILIVGAEQPNGRKRSWLLLDLAWQYDLHAYHFVIIGTEWGDVVEKLRNLGVSVTHHEHVDHDALQTAYHTSDALLVTGAVEGGPLPVLEALASGLHVITPAYGFAKELTGTIPLAHYNDIETLHARLEELVYPVTQRMNAISGYTVPRYLQAHYDLFQELLDVPAASRYDWIEKIVDEIHPTYLMEIGTCRGDSAERMITAALKHQSWADIHYYGYDLFRWLSEAEMLEERSKQPEALEVVQRRLTRDRVHVTLRPGNTKETLAEPYSGGPVDFIFIDGGHSWDTIASDWKNLQRYIGPNTVILFDDYYTGEVGETGCQELIHSLNPNQWEITVLGPQETWGELRINMVKVKKR